MGSHDEQLAAAVDVIRAALGASTVALYHYGSAVQGGLRPASDLDLFVVVDRALDDRDRRALVDGLLAVSTDPASTAVGRPIEVTVVRGSSVASWPTGSSESEPSAVAPRREFQFGEWLRAEFERGFLSPATDDLDLAPLVATVHTASVAVIGPPAGELLAAVPPTALTAAMAAGVGDLLDDLDDDTTNVLLTLCRMVYTTNSGAVAPKDVAADWVLAEHELPGADQLAIARATYLDGPAAADPYDRAAVAVVAAELVAIVRAGTA